MADNDDDEIVVCCATPTVFTCAYLSANMACSYGPVQNMPSYTRPLTQLFTGLKNYWQLCARPILYLPRKDPHEHHMLILYTIY